MAAIVFSFHVAVQPVSGETFSEYQVKAVFLYNLVNFIQWPETAFGASDPRFTIGILGPDSFADQLERAVANERALGREIRIVRYSANPDFNQRPCQIFFSQIDKNDSWLALHEELSGRPVLTVSDHAGFTQQGGMINLLTTGNRIQLEINLENARRAGLKISAKLLSLARLVSSPR